MRNFRKDEQGNFAAMGAIAALTLTVAVGGAIDFSHQNNVETSLQAAVDGAALAGARSAKNGDTLKQQKQIAKKSFFTNCDIKSCNTVITPTYDNDGSTVRVTAKYPVDTSFLGILGVGSLMANATAEVGVDGGSSTPSATGEYTEIHILIDNTGSMNIPSSAAGITQIEALYNPYLKHDPTTVGCAFACHLASDDVGYDVTVGGKTGAVIARENGILMREDVVFTEAEGLVDYFQNHAGAHLFRIGA